MYIRAILTFVKNDWSMTKLAKYVIVLHFLPTLNALIIHNLTASCKIFSIKQITAPSQFMYCFCGLALDYENLQSSLNSFAIDDYMKVLIYNKQLLITALICLYDTIKKNRELFQTERKMFWIPNFRFKAWKHYMTNKRFLTIIT